MKLLIDFFKAYQSLTKSGIVLFVLVVGVCGYTVGMPAGRGVDLNYLIVFLIGLYCLSAGSLALNQGQEVTLDKLMERTQKRPIVSGFLNIYQALVIAFLLIFVGLVFLALISFYSFILGLITVFLYNIVYTYFWKKNWAFGAVPGALPGAMPPAIGYMAHEGSQFTDPQLFYLFGILFLWQMPHFWILAIKYKEDYKKGGVPVLPLAIGKDRTKFHISLYLLCYLGLASLAPLYITSGLMGSLIIWAFSIIVAVLFLRYLKNESKWLLFFLSLNFSILVFSLVPAFSVLYYYI